MIAKVDVKPFAASRARLLCRDGDELGTNALTGDPLRDDRIHEESVARAIPGDIYESDKFIPFPGAHPAETVLTDLSLPVVIQDRMIERLGV